MIIDQVLRCIGTAETSFCDAVVLRSPLAPCYNMGPENTCLLSDESGTSAPLPARNDSSSHALTTCLNGGNKEERDPSCCNLTSRCSHPLSLLCNACGCAERSPIGLELPTAHNRDGAAHPNSHPDGAQRLYPWVPQVAWSLGNCEIGVLRSDHSTGNLVYPPLVTTAATPLHKSSCVQSGM